MAPVSRLVVVSNRVALPRETRAGGLAVALRAALAEHGGLWFGWSGERSRDPAAQPRCDSDGNIRYATIDLHHDDYDGYYNGFANRTLWPALHFRPSLVHYRRDQAAAYARVNARFADALLPLLDADDTVWVHDYHLIPLGRLLRERGAKCRIGFFLHVPMPPPDMIVALPNHADVFGALSAYDLVGFHTARDVACYRDYVLAFRGGDEDADGALRVDGRRVRVGAFPISIDTALIERQAPLSMRRAEVRRLRESMGGRLLAIGVDRLDYSKGLPDRFRAVAHFLERAPALRGRLSYLQIAPHSRSEVPEYQALRRELESLTGSINGRYAEPEWTPIRYVNRNFSQETLAGFYRSARVGLVTPLRDGMNLVAKEFVAAQEAEDPGVLVLSQFAGAVHALPEALAVNPYDVDGVADAIVQAATMPLDERRERWESMMRTLRRHDITAWRRGFLDALASA